MEQSKSIIWNVSDGQDIYNICEVFWDRIRYTKERIIKCFIKMF